MALGRPFRGGQDEGRNRSGPTSNLKLSPQQVRVARLVAEGFRSREIAELLQITPRTVAVHRYQVVRRLGLRSTSAIGLALAELETSGPEDSASPGLNAANSTPPEKTGPLTFLPREQLGAETDWEAAAKGILLAHMKENGVTYGRLAERLTALGVREDARTLRNKVNGGKFTAVFLLQCVKACVDGNPG